MLWGFVGLTAFDFLAAKDFQRLFAVEGLGLRVLGDKIGA